MYCGFLRWIIVMWIFMLDFSLDMMLTSCVMLGFCLGCKKKTYLVYAFSILEYSYVGNLRSWWWVVKNTYLAHDISSCMNKSYTSAFSIFESSKFTVAVVDSATKHILSDLYVSLLVFVIINRFSCLKYLLDITSHR